METVLNKLIASFRPGPKPQTRFVLKKAIEMGHKIVVVVNKIDRPNSRPDYVLDSTFDLFVELVRWFSLSMCMWESLSFSPRVLIPSVRIRSVGCER